MFQCDMGLRQLFGVLAYCVFNQWREVFLEVRGHPNFSENPAGFLMLR